MLAPATSVDTLEVKLENLSKDLTRWSGDTFRSLRKKIKEIKHILFSLQSEPNRHGSSSIELRIVEKLVELYYREEVIWHQRS